MLSKMKNIDAKEVIELKDMIDIYEGQVLSRTLSQNENVSLTLFGFDKDEMISTHQSEGDALLTVLEGKARITIDDTDYILKTGESIVMPALHPHAVYALENMKMFLTVIF